MSRPAGASRAALESASDKVEATTSSTLHAPRGAPVQLPPTPSPPPTLPSDPHHPHVAFHRAVQPHTPLAVPQPVGGGLLALSPAEPALPREAAPATRLDLTGIGAEAITTASIGPQSARAAKKRLFVSKRTFSANSPHFGKGEPVIEWEYGSVSSSGGEAHHSDTPNGRQPLSARGSAGGGAPAPNYRAFWGTSRAVSGGVGVGGGKRGPVITGASRVTQSSDALSSSFAQQAVMPRRSGGGTARTVSGASTSSDDDESCAGDLAEPAEQPTAAPLLAAMTRELVSEGNDKYVANAGSRRLHSAPTYSSTAAVGSIGGGGGGGASTSDLERSMPPPTASPLSFANRYRRTVESYAKQNSSRVGTAWAADGDSSDAASGSSTVKDRETARKAIAMVRRASRPSTDTSLRDHTDDGEVSSSVSSTSSSFSSTSGSDSDE